MARIAACSFALSLSLLTTLTQAAEPDSWPQWRGPNRDGISSSTGLLQSWETQKPKLRWMSEGAGSGYASVSIADGKIFTSGNTGAGQAIVAMSQADGSVLWKTVVTAEDPEHGFKGSRTTPTYDQGRLYVVASNGQLICLDARNGDILWSNDWVADYGANMMSKWGFSESPLVDGDRVLCTPGGPEAMVVCFDKHDGSEIWKSKVPAKIDDGLNYKGKQLKKGAGYSSIVVSHGAGVKQYVQLVGQGVVGVRASDGQYLWGYEEVNNSTANIPTPVAVGDYVFCSTSYGTGSALLKLSGKGGGVKAEEVYQLNDKQLQNHHGGFVQLGDYIYGGHDHSKGYPFCIQWRTGEIVWGGARNKGPGSGSAAVTYADGNLIFRYDNGTVALIEASPNGYKLKGTFTPEYQQGKSWAHPVVLDGLLYLREQDKMMCYDLRP